MADITRFKKGSPIVFRKSKSLYFGIVLNVTEKNTVHYINLQSSVFSQSPVTLKDLFLRRNWVYSIDAALLALEELEARNLLDNYNTAIIFYKLLKLIIYFSIK